MRRWIIVWMVMWCGWADAISQNQEVSSDKYLITGNVANVPDGVVMRLLEEQGMLLAPVMQDTVANGTFAFSDTLSCVRKYLLLSIDDGFPGNYLEVWVAPGKQVQVTGQDKLICVWEVVSDIPEQLEANAFQTCAGDLRRECTALEVIEKDWLKKLNGKAENDKAVWDEVNALRKTLDPMRQELYKKELDYMQTAPIGRVWMEHLAMYAKMSVIKEFMPYIKELKSLYARVPQDWWESKEGRMARQYLYATGTVGVGDEMVDADLYDVEGNIHRLSSFKGKYILLDFWSVGCGPCIASFPEIEAISQAYQVHWPS